MPEQITSRENQTVKIYCSLAQKKKRDALGLFTAEGLRLCLDAVDGGLVLHTLLITDDALVRYPQATRLVRQAGQCFHISEDLSRRIGDTQHPQGIFCMFRKPAAKQSFPPVTGNVLMISDLQDPGNLGTMLRTAQALGMDAALLSGTADPYSPKVLRSSMGALFRFPVFEFDNTEQMIAAVRRQQIPVYAAALTEHAQRLGCVALPERDCGLLIGNEGSGLADDVVRLCDAAIMIPMHSGADSLNAASAAAILMWEICRRRKPGVDTGS